MARVVYGAVKNVFKNTRGFGLLSVLVSLQMTAILAVCIVISYRTFIERHQMSAIANNLAATLRFARSVAIASGGSVRFCPLASDQKHCGTDWQQGQLLLTGDHQVLRVYAAIPKHYRLYWRSRLGLNRAIAWGDDGFTVGQQGSFWLCQLQGGDSGRVRQIILLQTGRVRILQRHRCQPVV